MRYLLFIVFLLSIQSVSSQRDRSAKLGTLDQNVKPTSRNTSVKDTSATKEVKKAPYDFYRI
ncbi:hypothetical protein, partial [Flavobacterium sp.]